MKRQATGIIAALLCCASFSQTAQAQSTNAEALKMMSGYFGTWDCVTGKAHNTSTFSRILDGRGMSITGGGNAMVKESDQAIYDAKRNRWIYYYMGADGAYAVMEGVPAGNKIKFVQVYPTSGTTMVVTNVTKRQYTEVMTVGGHMVLDRKCVKNP